MYHHLTQFIYNFKIKRYGFLANLCAVALVIATLTFFSWNGKLLSLPIAKIHPEVISLKFSNLFAYSIHTIFRMIVGIIISLIFSICYATLASQNQKTEEIMIPMLDVLQSVPILGYISFTTAGFIALAPETSLGFEMVAIFAIFTSQAWNITFGVYQSFKNLPQELLEVAAIHNFSSWRRFWTIKIPYAIPSIIWNSMVSMSGAWFFIVAAECISYKNIQVSLPGIGSYIALALNKKDVSGIIASILTMIIIIFLFDQIVFKTLLSWSDKFCYNSENKSSSKHWLYSLLVGSVFCQHILLFWNKWVKFFLKVPIGVCIQVIDNPTKPNKIFEFLWIALICVICFCSINYIYSFLSDQVSIYEVLNVFRLTSITFFRILVLSIIVSIIFVPLSIYIGNNPYLRNLAQPVVQLLSSLPANLFFPVAFICIKKYSADPEIWLSPLLIIGSGWYIVFNVISGASQMPYDFLLVAKQFNIKSFLKYKRILLPAIMPYYVTGLITTIGGAWNASIIAEIITWGGQSIYAEGIGSYIAISTQQNDFYRITLGISIMSFSIVVLNKLFWQKAYVYVNKKFSYT